MSTKRIASVAIAAAFAVVMALLVVTAGSVITAEAGVDAISASDKTAGEEAPVTITIHADEGGGDLTVITTAGMFTGALCQANLREGMLVQCAANLDAGGEPETATAPPTTGMAPTATALFIIDDLQVDGENQAAIGDHAHGTEFVIVTFACPSVGPVKATITAIQGGSSAMSTTVNCRGNADTMEISVTNISNKVIKNINAAGATLGYDDARINARPMDSNGNTLEGSVIFVATDGTLVDGNVSPITRGWARKMFTSSPSTGAGDTETVTASSGGKSADAEVHFSGDPKTCTVAVDPEAPAAGTLVDVSVTMLDSSGGPAADGIRLNTPPTGTVADPKPSESTLQVVNAVGTGTFAIFGEKDSGSIEPGDGVATAKLAVGLSGGTALVVSVKDATCGGSVDVGGTAVPPVVPPVEGMGGTFTGTAPSAGSIGLLVTSGAASAADLIAALQTADCTVESISVLDDGAWLTFINGAPDVVNAAFPASLADLTPFFVRCG